MVAVIAIGVGLVAPRSSDARRVSEPPWNSSATTGAAEDLFGYHSTIQGDTLVVGSPRDDTPAGSWAGSAYVGTLSGTSWTLDATLNHPNPAAGDSFGRSVDLDAGTLVATSLRDDLEDADPAPPAPAEDAGSAHIFVQSGSSWSLEATLTHPEPGAVDAFGRWAAISGDTVIVGVPRDDTDAGADTGSALVFTRSGTAWTQEAMLTSPRPTLGAFFGKAVDIDGDTIVVGEPGFRSARGKKIGAAHVYLRSGTTWTLQATLVHPKPGTGDNFGRWVSVDGDTTAVAAPADNNKAGSHAGSVHVFVRSGTTWSRQASINLPIHQADASFGHREIVVGDTLLVGARRVDTPAGQAAGAAFVFKRSGTTWTYAATITSPTPAATDQFGRAVTLNQDATVAVIGEPYDDTAGQDAGAVHVFDLIDGSWVLRTTIINPNTTSP
jgi:hypothetical protein